MSLLRWAAVLAATVSILGFLAPGPALGQADDGSGGLFAHGTLNQSGAIGDAAPSAVVNGAPLVELPERPVPALPAEPEAYGNAGEKGVNTSGFGVSIDSAAPLLDEAEAETVEPPQWGDIKGITIPKRPEVKAVINEFSTVGRSTFAGSLERARTYLPLIKHELGELNLPLELAALALVESHFQPDARSGAGAAGIWQFIEPTARIYDLRVDWWVDQRLDPVMSTRAAARHLKDLYEKFGDWSLAVAAYNAGSGGVERAMTRTGLPTFWDLYEVNGLRRETRRYVAKFYAAAAIMNDPVAFGFEPPEENGHGGFDVVEVDSPVDFVTVSKITGVEFKELAGLNPGLKRGCTPPGGKSYELRVPVGYGETLARKLADIPPEERLSFKRHKVLRGETIWKIAKKYSVEPEAVTMLNCLKDPKKIKTGDELVIPVNSQAKPEKGGNKPEKESDERRAANKKSGITKGTHASVHVVASGDTLWSIAKENGTTVERLCALNGLKSNSRLRVGQEVKTKR